MSDDLAGALARVMTTGEQSHEAVLERARHVFDREWRFLDGLVRRYLARFAEGTKPRVLEVAAFVAADAGFRKAQLRHPLKLVRVPLGEPMMQPNAAAVDWPVPSLTTIGELAAKLRLEPEHLLWFADLKQLNRKAAGQMALQHYLYRLVEKRSGGVRLIEQPKPRLKLIQRQILNEILSMVPAHVAVHGFVPGRSIRSFAAPHAGRDAVLRMDLQDFFPSIGRARIQTVFRLLGYPEPVADLLGGLCTNLAPRAAFASLEAHRRRTAHEVYGRSHLPQGAPSSPALANICCHRVDGRLSGLSAASGVTYTRYADDLAFSGDSVFARSAQRFAAHVGAIVAEEGLSVNFRKTRLMRQGVRQSLAGIVVNESANIARDQIDQLRAILTNCARHGLASQNRDLYPDFGAHLQGRIAFVESINAARGRKLRQLWNGIRAAEQNANLLDPARGPGNT